MFMLGALGLSLIALFVAMNASGKADSAVRRIKALEARLAGQAETAAGGGGGEVPSPEAAHSEAG